MLYSSKWISVYFLLVYCIQQRETRTRGDWEESKRLITKHPFNETNLKTNVILDSQYNVNHRSFYINTIEECNSLLGKLYGNGVLCVEQLNILLPINHFSH